MSRNYSAKQKKVKVSIIGGKEIANRLKNMEGAASSILQSAAKSGGKIALDDAIRRCPVNTGALKNSLKLENGKATPVRADVKINYDKSIKYGAFVELGANGRAGNPFMRNAVDENIEKINKTITEKLAEAVERKM